MQSAGGPARCQPESGLSRVMRKAIAVRKPRNPLLAVQWLFL